MTDERPRHARIAADFWDHPRTEWMHPLHRDVFTQAVAANALGLLELPMARIAKRCKSTEEEVAIAMHQMDDEKVAVWWRDLGIFWVVNAPEHNCWNKMMWRSAFKVWRAQPLPVRDRVLVSWPNIANASLPYNGEANAGANGEANAEASTFTAEKANSVSVSVSVSDLVNSEVARFRESWAKVISALRTELGPTNDPTRDPQAYAGLCEAIGQHGRDLVLEVTAWAVRKAPTGKLTATMFRGAAFGAHLDAYVAAQKADRGRAMVAPHKLAGRVLTDAEQREWTKVASGGGDPETALRASWEAEEQQANDLAEELWPS